MYSNGIFNDYYRTISVYFVYFLRYQVTIYIIPHFLPGRVWTSLRKKRLGLKEELTFKHIDVSITSYFRVRTSPFLTEFDWILLSQNIKSEQQPMGSNLCAYFVCEWIRQEVSGRNDQTFIEVSEQFYFYYHQLCVVCHLRFLFWSFILIILIFSIFYSVIECDRDCTPTTSNASDQFKKKLRDFWISMS